MKQKYYDNEIPKYFKKKNPSISKAKEKSKHKHLYIDCLLIEDGRPYKSTYCTVCGKIKNTKFGEFVLLDNGKNKMLNDNEIFEKYKDLTHFKVYSIFQKYVLI